MFIYQPFPPNGPAPLVVPRNWGSNFTSPPPPPIYLYVFISHFLRLSYIPNFSSPLHMVKIIYLKIQNQNSHLRTNNCRYRSWKYPSQQESKAVKNKKSECKYRYPITQHVSHNHFLSIKRVTHFLVNKMNTSFVFTKVCHSIYSHSIYIGR